MSDPLTITEAAEAIRVGTLTPIDLLEQCLARIDRYEERVKAWAYLDREGAREQADRLTAELKSTGPRGPLHGIPVGIKDIIDVFDMPTGCGSKRWATSYARRDATCVERLRQAGAVIVGKTVTTAYASFDPPPTRNPWNLDRTPGGSSSGSAAAVACGMCLGALATQTGGSITRPASYCGVYSLKPTYGRVSVDGVLPLAPSLDHVGVMANCVRDLAILFQTICGRDDEDWKSLSATVPDCIRSIDHVLNPGRSWELGFMFLGGKFADLVQPNVEEPYEQFRQALRDREEADTLRVRSVMPPAGFESISIDHHIIMGVEAAAYHAPRIARDPDDYPPKITELINFGRKIPAPAYHQSLERQRRASNTHHDLGSPYPLVTPATTDVPGDLTSTGNPAFNSPWSFLGYATISLPVAWSADGMPVAVQLVGGLRNEIETFAHAAYLERAFPFDRRPLPLDYT
ncbi:MAG: amidase [Gemmataceae bacterium]|nr:amidase [Gemmataceae bacterium]